MRIKPKSSRLLVIAAATALVLTGGALVATSGLISAGTTASSGEIEEADATADQNEVGVAPGTIDDGQALLPEATITLAEAIAAARLAAPGEVGEVDLEYFGATLVFNVDVGKSDVKVDAGTGAFVAVDIDD